VAARNHGVRRVPVVPVLVLPVVLCGVLVVLPLLQGHRTTRKKINKKMYRGALRCILSELVRQDRLLVVDDFKVDSHKTKGLIDKLNELELQNVLIVSDEVDQNLYLAARNLHKVDVLEASGVDPVSLIGFDKVLMTVPALKKVEGMLA